MTNSKNAAGSDLGYTPALDGLRAMAVLTVIAFHVRGTFFPGGYIGVDVFFVLSGFLITSLLVGEHRRTARISLPRFYLRRALRLVPALVLVCLALALACLTLPVHDMHSNLVGDVSALLYASSPLAASGHDLGAMLPTWSLSVEEYFYLVWPAALLLCLRRRSPVTWVSALLGLAVLYRWVVPALLHWGPMRISYGADTRTEQLLVGVLLALVLGRLGRIPVAVGVLAAALLVAFVVAPAGWTSSLYLGGGSTVIAVLAAVVIAVVMQRTRQRSMSLLTNKWSTWVGARSYGMYLWHNPVIVIVAATGLPGILQEPVKLVLIFVVPALSYRYAEKPFLRLKDRIRRTRPGASEPVPARSGVPGPAPAAATLASRVARSRTDH